MLVLVEVVADRIQEREARLIVRGHCDRCRVRQQTEASGRWLSE